MQRIFVILVFISGIESLKIVNGQVPDTLRYLRQIVANKALFINQPFSKLEDSLAISIKGFVPTTPIHNINLEKDVIFRFVYSNNPEDISLSYPWLIVEWDVMPEIRNTYRLFYQQNRGKYSADVRQYYRPFIVKDIYLIE